MNQTEAKLSTAFRIRRAVCLMSEKRPSQERCIIDQFLRFISPSMAKGNGVDFPRTCRRHALDAERSAHGGGTASVVYFHIGNAILGFYDYLNLTAKAATPQADLDAALAVVERRVFILECVAKYGLDCFYSDGNDTAGYTLNPKPPLAIEGFNALLNTAKV